jgi:hypothetical protein
VGEISGSFPVDISRNSNFRLRGSCSKDDGEEWRSSVVILQGISGSCRLRERKLINSEYMSENSIYCAPSRGSQEFCVHRVIHKSGASSCSDRVGGRP